MLKRIIIIILIIVNSLSYAKVPNYKAVLEEGKMLYHLEKASWYGTDIFLKYYKDKVDSVAGYISYYNSQEVINVFFNRFDTTKVLARIIFDSIPQINPKRVEIEDLDVFRYEFDLFSLTKNARARIYAEQDTFFKFYKNTQFNLIPIISETYRKVFVLTASKDTENVLLGNDYIIYFDESNQFIRQERLHYSLIKLPMKSDSMELTMSTHTHILDEIITSTDICTLLLYKDFAQWKSHYVFSKEWVSIFDMKNENLFIMPLESFKKINDNNGEPNIRK